ncbi:hypothetical protein RND71_023455 [Anisodus tanguticus]|uniref:Uncharacterized protein n=1 Tax=Anisodus tanguticus TaxID=243964 RepID=A0AAE1RT47_9SOLA|nr:hypothetical protein RND71_023455 [Anisodus tanguticus]
MDHILKQVRRARGRKASWLILGASSWGKGLSGASSWGKGLSGASSWGKGFHGAFYGSSPPGQTTYALCRVKSEPFVGLKMSPLQESGFEPEQSEKNCKTSFHRNYVRQGIISIKVHGNYALSGIVIAKLRPRLLIASGRLIPSPEIQVSTDKDLLIPRGRLGSKLPLAYLTPFLELVMTLAVYSYLYKWRMWREMKIPPPKELAAKGDTIMRANDG